jgi:nucleoid-associated protein EbfC
MGSGFSKRKKQARDMQEKFLKMQEEMKHTEATGSAGGGLVEVTLNGEHELKKIKINPECVDPEDVEGLEDLVLAAFKDAHAKISSEGLPNDLQNIPGMPDLGALGF